jgi:hypothetical protein
MPYEGKFRIKELKVPTPLLWEMLCYELEESSDTVTGTITYSREKELHRSEISEFIPSDAYYCV